LTFLSLGFPFLLLLLSIMVLLDPLNWGIGDAASWIMRFLKLLRLQLISKGRNVSSFFPDVVKNVVSKHPDVRKLVYIYLVRYAEEEPDIALLSINSFQKVLLFLLLSFPFIFFL